MSNERLGGLAPRRGSDSKAQGDASLLGAVTLEELGLVLDPLRRELRPLPMQLV